MKRGKNDEKMIGPMFPRLHVNDTEKGGPRAPPRNKMALYEQLSIPSRTFNPGVLPSNQNHSRNMVPPVSTNQSKKFDAGNAHGLDGNVQLAQLERRKKAGDEEDYRVPDFVQSRAGQCHGEVHNDIDREKLASISPTHAAYQMELQNVCDKTALNLSQEERNESEENPKLGGLGSDHSKRSTVDQLTRENIHRTAKNTETSSDQEFRKNLVHYSNGLLVNEVFRPQEYRAQSQPDSIAGDCGIINSDRGIDDRVVPEPRCVSHFSENHGSPKVIGNNCESNGDRRCMSLRLGSEDKSDDVSDSSMVDSLSGSDLSPDDVVGIIGQRHFWKARREIVNQQRVFAVQVFELHRLIKVQRLIAGSPNLMLEDGAFLGKSPLKGSPTKKLPSEYAVKLLPRVIKRKDYGEKPVQKMEHSAENAVGKTSLSSVKNGQLSSYEPYAGTPTPTPTPVSSDNKMAPWCFHQSPGHQWLIPVMSPSEGLVYKPYPGPEFMGTVSDGCGPYGSTPMTGNFTNPSHGIPTSQHHAMGGFLGASPVGHPYYAPYGIPVTNPATTGSAVEQMNQSMNCGTSHGSHSQVGPVLEEGAYRSMQHQGVCNTLLQKKGTVAQGLKFQVSRDSDLQGSTASSPGEKRTQGIGIGHSAEGKDPLPLSPFTPAVPDDASQHHDADHTTRVIKVVPHNPRSATESAARIFQSIQEERKQYDSI